MSARTAVVALPVVRVSGAVLFVSLVVVFSLPAFLLRLTGVMDDSVFWVVAKSVNTGRVLYRDIYFTQPPLFIWIPQLLWALTDNIFLHRVFLIGVWLANGWLFYQLLDRLRFETRLALTGVFLTSAFILQSYALHTEVFVLTVFLLGTLAVTQRIRYAELALGLAAGASLMLKPLAPVVFVPVMYAALVNGPDRMRKLAHFALGAAIPVTAVAVYLLVHGTAMECWQQVVRDNANIGFALDPNWFGVAALTIVPLLLPGFAAVVAIDRRPRDAEWWLSVAIFGGLLALEVLRGARHYGLLNLCILAWMAARAQRRFEFPTGLHLVVVRCLAIAAIVFQLTVVYEILVRGSIADELAASSFVNQEPTGSLQVFANGSPRIYMLLNRLSPAYQYLFVYDTNRDRILWDSYVQMVDAAPPQYIAVADDFVAVEYGQRHSTVLVDAASVRTWIERRGDYRRVDGTQLLGIALYQRQPA
jgi:hypothetical protein